MLEYTYARPLHSDKHRAQALLQLSGSVAGHTGIDLSLLRHARGGWN